MSKPKVLIVDDEPAHIMLCKRTLKKTFPELEILDAETITTGSALIKSDADIKLVLLDMNLGQASGLSLLKEIRLTKDIQSFTVLMISTSELPEDFHQAYIELANGYLFKAVDPQVFQDTVRKAVGFFLNLT